ncbi:extracellular solute-binding protein [Paenibacillus sp. GD4]|jgi:ABC-type glycerol-3-phosphate transport system substrate-binding protein|uniref:ABC transporter substrate-binding protein n=1 Tax=Paenibacillus sp. GD4 TaxID=3068890 RepID=UPI002796AC2F|nr:extracellular solute-binding protein [Paenibacillus sp. GD4]MDQ1913915.1 extracellular solute-binding protein [Paenibacillus sp. GD4]
MLKKGFVFSAASLLILSACSGQVAQNPGDSPKPAQTKEPVELVVYSTAATSEEEFKQKFTDPIEKQFPEIKLKYIKKGTGTNIDELVSAGQHIDLYYESVNFFHTMTRYGLATDMSDLIKKHNVDISAFEPTMIDYARAMSGSGIYGLPVSTENVILFYNKDIFDKFGVSYPKNGMTWNEIHDLAKKLTRNEGGKQYLGFVASPAHTLRANQYSLTFLDPKTDKATINANEKWKQVYQTYYIEGSTDAGYKAVMGTLKNKLPYKDAFLKDRNLAMFAYLSQLDWAAGGAEGMNWDIASLPTFSDLPGVGSSAYPFYWGVTAQSKHKDEAMAVIKYLTGKEYQTKQVRGGTMTTLKDDAIKKQFGEDSKHKDKNLSAVFHNKYAPLPAKSMVEGDAQPAYENAVHEAALGTADLNTLFRTIEETANKAAESAKAKK